MDRTETSKLIGFSNNAISCGSADDSDPPPGTFASISLPSFDVGHYASALVNVYTSVGGFRGKGSNSGVVEITSSDADSIAGSVAFTYTDDGKTYSFNGSFEVLHCPK